MEIQEHQELNVHRATEADLKSTFNFQKPLIQLHPNSFDI